MLTDSGRYFLKLSANLGRITLLAGTLSKKIFTVFRRPGILFNQIYGYGVRGVVIMLAAAVFTGLVLALQTYQALTVFRAEAAAGALTALAVIRELGPVLAALLFVSSAGAALTGELVLMRVNDELDALAVMGIDPWERVIAPRFWAGVIALPLLTLIFSAAALAAVFVLTVFFYGTDSTVFWENTQNALTAGRDVGALILKSWIFGFLAALVSVYNGLHAAATPAGLTRAAYATVVWGTVLILAADLMVTVFCFTG